MADLRLGVSREVAEAAQGWFEALRPPPRLSLAEWARENVRLDDGRPFVPYPYQVEILDAMCDPEVTSVTLRKSARVGYTQMLAARIAYGIAQSPVKQMVVQPTVEDAEDYSKDTIEKLHEWPCMEGRLQDPRARNKGDTIKRKAYPGGSLRIVGANSPRAFRRIDLDVILFDEVDGYPRAAGKEGDQISLGRKRLTQSIQPLDVVGSTPLIKGTSKVDDRFGEGTQEFYHVPCPHCGEMQPLVWGDGTGAGMRWERDEPSTAYYVCVSGCLIDEAYKEQMLEGGRWVASAPFKGHRSFHIWQAYSLLPGAAWRFLVKEFLDARRDPDKLKVWTNTVLGEPWQDRGEAPDWERLYERREDWPAARAPDSVLFLTGGIDVQGDRLELYVWGWGRGLQSWLVDRRIIEGDPARAETWAAMDETLADEWQCGNAALRLARVAIDTGYATQEVYGWARRQRPGFVMAIKGADHLATPVGTATAVDVTAKGKRVKRGIRVWPVGVSMLKSEFYGQLRQPVPVDGEDWPKGFVHLPKSADPEICKQLVAEQLVTLKTGRREWQKLRERNEALDCRIYARAAAAAMGVDRWGEKHWSQLEAALGRGTAADKPKREPPSRPIETDDEPDVPAPTPPAPAGVLRSRPRRVHRRGVFMSR